MRHTFSLLLAFFALIPGVVQAADGSLLLLPESGTYPIGQTFQVSVYADPDDVTGKAAEADIRFDRTLLEVAAISTANSALTLWSVEPTYSNEEGLVRFAGWSNNPFVGRNLLLTITFRPKASGTHTVRIESGALLQSDGRATNILTQLGSGTYITEPESIPSISGDGVVLGAETQSDDAPPEAPAVSLSTKDVRSGDYLVFSGIGPKEGRVNVWIEKDGGTPVRESVEASKDGVFMFTSSDRLESGSYRVWFEAYSKYGVLSPQTEPMSLTVLPYGADLVASAAMNIITTPVFIGLALLVFGFLFGYLGYRVVTVRA
jgi:hypothetical protein